MAKGLLVSTYRCAEFGDCSRGGVTSRFDQFVLTGKGLPPIFEAEPEERELVLVLRWNGRGEPSHYAIPRALVGSSVRPMFGGNYVGTSDSRFGEATESQRPLPVHDRVEGGPRCGHSLCSQHYIDTGATGCIRGEQGNG